jgi:hypothetical protein
MKQLNQLLESLRAKGFKLTLTLQTEGGGGLLLMYRIASYGQHSDILFHCDDDSYDYFFRGKQHSIEDQAIAIEHLVKQNSILV